MNPQYPPEEIVVRLKMLIKTIEGLQEKFGDDVSHAQLRILFPIIKNDRGYTIQELSDMAGVTKGFGSRTVADLEAKGIVQREKLTANQDRNFKIVLSPKGHDLVEERKKHIREISGSWEGKISRDEFYTFGKVLFTLTDGG